MAKDGEGPLTSKPATPAILTTKAAQAARDISRVSTEFWALYEVAQSLSCGLGLAETIEILARKLAAIFPGVSCIFLLKEEGEENLKGCTAIGINSEFFTDVRTINQFSLSRRIAESAESYIGEYDQDDLLLTSSDSAQWEELRSAIIVPIAYEGEVLGTINLYHSVEGYFTDHDCQLLETIAERAAMAIFNGILFERTRGHALTDPLTGVYNIRYLTEHVEERCRSGKDSPFALLCLDLDCFKPINDNFGHQKGDQVLCDLARIFRDVVGADNIVARYGGDEFLIVLEGADVQEAEEVTTRIQEAVSNYDPELLHIKLGRLSVGVSIGIASFPHDGEDWATLLSTADVGMYRQKSERKLKPLASSSTDVGVDHTPADQSVA